MLRSAYRLTNRLLGTVNLQLIRADRSINFFSPSLNRLERLGFIPDVVFDIGVATGTPELYRAFPKAKYLLIDPLPQSMPYMRQWARVLTAEIHNVALGESDDELAMDVRNDIGGSSFFKSVSPVETQQITVKVRRFDSLFPEIQSRTLVKIDVQGAELMVLKGMGRLLDAVEVFIIETRSLLTSVGAPHMLEVVGFMKERGYAIYDICGINRRPLDGAMAQIDLMFCNESSALLKEKRWS